MTDASGFGTFDWLVCYEDGYAVHEVAIVLSLSNLQAGAFETVLWFEWPGYARCRDFTIVVNNAPINEVRIMTKVLRRRSLVLDVNSVLEVCKGVGTPEGVVRIQIGFRQDGCFRGLLAEVSSASFNIAIKRVPSDLVLAQQLPRPTAFVRAVSRVVSRLSNRAGVYQLNPHCSRGEVVPASHCIDTRLGTIHYNVDRARAQTFPMVETVFRPPLWIARFRVVQMLMAIVSGLIVVLLGKALFGNGGVE